MKHLLFYKVLGIILLTSCGRYDILDDITDEPQTLRTVIVYMAADNDLSDYAWGKIMEMQNGDKNKNTHFIVFFDLADDSPHILEIEQGSHTKVMSYPEFNSADADHMNQVLNDIIEMYPAKSYGLVLWSHATSWLPARGMRLMSFGLDKGHRMPLNALAAALPLKFDFILMDACLMNAVEVAYELRDKTDFIIASPTEMLYSGFSYENIMYELTNAEPDLKKVAADYIDFYNGMSGILQSASISLIKTCELERLATITNQLIANGTFDSETFDRTSVQRLDVYEEQYTFDFLDFMEKAFPDADIAPLKQQLGKTVLYEAHTSRFLNRYEIKVSCGLSCYIPHPYRNDLNTYYQRLEWCKDAGFSNLFKPSNFRKHNHKPCLP